MYACTHTSIQYPCPLFQALALCRAVHEFHFQLLVLLGSYIKLLDTLQPALENPAVSSFEVHAELCVFQLFLMVWLLTKACLEVCSIIAS